MDKKEEPAGVILSRSLLAPFNISYCRRRGGELMVIRSSEREDEAHNRYVRYDMARGKEWNVATRILHKLHGTYC